MAVLFLTVGAAAAGESSPEPRESFNHRHQAGLRIGVWGNLGEIPMTVDTLGSSIFNNDFNSASFYIEGFFGYRIMTQLVGELSAGIVSRGDIQLLESGTSYSGSLIVYPVLLRLRYYPLSALNPKYHPYLSVGGGIYHARHDIQYASGQYAGFAAFYEEASETSFDFVVGGGFDWPVAAAVGLEFNAQYMPIRFGSAIIGVNDWSSLTFTVGVKYLFDMES
ncbi:MAG TPA: outer membrane beta-barrel protein [Acidobacteriota bacterium]|nr:outer membrane beta-barrel protein [Acidobacteriota bacterium]